MLKDVTVDGTLEAFTPLVTGWHHIAIHADADALEAGDGAGQAVAASPALDFDGANVTLTQFGVTLDSHSAVAAGQLKTVNLRGGVPVKSVVAAAGASTRIRIEAIPLQIA